MFLRRFPALFIRVAKNELPADETTAKFFSALLLSSLRSGKELFKSMLTEENKEELKNKAAGCGLLQEEKKN
jgi:hypothetical protein